MEILYFLAFLFQFLGRVKSQVSLSVIEQLLYILFIDLASLTLTVGAVVATEGHSLIKLDAEPFERLDDIVFCPRHKPVAVGVLDAKNEIAAVLACKQIIVECRADTANMQWTRWARGKTYPYFSFRHNKTIILLQN